MVKDLMESNNKYHRTEEQKKEALQFFVDMEDKAAKESDTGIKMIENKLGKLDSIKDFGHKTSAQDIDKSLGLGKGSYNPSLTNYMDNVLVEKASGGLALCGILFTNSCEALSKPILKCPDKISLKQALLPTGKYIHEITLIGKESKIQSTMQSLGYSLGLEVLGITDAMFLSLKRQQEKTKSSTEQSQSTTISKSLFYLVPMASFSFDREELKLTDEVMKAVKKLENSILGSATGNKIDDGILNFLYEFGSHVNLGVVHLGGMFTQNASYERKSTEGQDTELQAVYSSLKAALAANVEGFGIGTKQSDGSSSSNYCATDNSEIRFSTTAIGGPPTAESSEKWLEGLEKSNRNWAIIDRGLHLGKDFHGVWELIPKRQELQYPNGLAALIRYLWHDKFGESKEFRIDNDKENEELKKLLEKQQEKLEAVLKENQEYLQQRYGPGYSWYTSEIDLSALTQDVLKLQRKIYCGPCTSLNLVKGRLWCSYKSKISAWDKQLQPCGTMECNEEGQINAIQDVKGQGFLLGTNKGLFLMSYNGIRKTKLTDGNFVSVTANSQHSFAGKIKYYFTTTEYWIYVHSLKTMKFETAFAACGGNRFSEFTLCASESLLYVAWSSGKFLTLSLEGKIIHSQDKLGHGLGKFYHPEICQTDNKNNILIVDKYNGHMQICSEGFWNSVKTCKGASCSQHALFIESALYVCDCAGMLLMYEMEQKK